MRHSQNPSIDCSNIKEKEKRIPGEDISKLRRTRRKTIEVGIFYRRTRIHREPFSETNNFELAKHAAYTQQLVKSQQNSLQQSASSWHHCEPGARCVIAEKFSWSKNRIINPRRENAEKETDAAMRVGRILDPWNAGEDLGEQRDVGIQQKTSTSKGSRRNTESEVRERTKMEAKRKITKWGNGGGESE